MAPTMKEFHGTDPAQIEKLKAAGIENTDQLMKLWSDKEKRGDLVSTTGIPEADFMKFASMARLSRVKGMDMENIAVLVAAGIDGPKRLFSYTPETLVTHLGEAAAAQKVTGTLPTLEQIKAWFANPKPEPTVAK